MFYAPEGNNRKTRTRCCGGSYMCRTRLIRHAHLAHKLNENDHRTQLITSITLRTTPEPLARIWTLDG